MIFTFQIISLVTFSGFCLLKEKNTTALWLMMIAIIVTLLEIAKI